MQLGSLEQHIMKYLWKKHTSTPFTVREIADSLDARKTTGTNKTEYAYNTILTVITHLYKKGLLSRNKHGKTCVYRVDVSENAFVQQASAELFAQMQKQHGALAVAHFANIMESVDPKILRDAKEMLAKKS